MSAGSSIADEQGYGATARAALTIYEGHARRTGRTARLIERLGPDDQVVCPNNTIADHLRRRLREAKKPSVRVIVVDPREVPLTRVATAPRGRTFYEHTWVLDFFMRQLSEAERDLDRWAAAMSKTWPAAPGPESERAYDLERSHPYVAPEG